MPSNRWETPKILNYILVNFLSHTSVLGNFIVSLVL